MKNNNIELKNVIIFVVVILFFSVMYIVVDRLVNKKNDEPIYMKNYEVNEYIPVYVSDEDMAKMYLNDYIHTMYSDINKAYNLLDEEYRSKKFANIENYRAYISNLNSSSYELDSFYIDDSKKNKIYGIYDTNGNMFIFETNGIMQYKVYLDDYTVEI